MKALNFILIGILLQSIVISTYAQSTFSNIYTILQANCATSCHNPSSLDGNLDLSGTVSDVYSQLVEVTPTNTSAATADLKRVDPGYPLNSYLLRKINGSFDIELALGSGMGSTMPIGTPQLSEFEKELVRQWILQEAPETGMVVDETIIKDFYDGKGLAFIDRPENPVEKGKSGYQIHIGPFFLAPQQEVEYFKKESINFSGLVDGVREELFMNWQSHHFTLYELPEINASNLQDGLLLVTGAFTGSVVHLFGKQIGGWDISADIELPQNTAFKWDDNTVFVLNYHLKNYHPDSILRADAYVNIYTETQSNSTEMLVAFPNFGGDNPFSLEIPPTGGAEYTEELHFFEENSSEVWNIWRLRGHTHQLGIDFDGYMRNPDGTKGIQIYEGWSNGDHTFNQGFWDYEHAATRTFEPFLEVKASDGLIFEATWVNNTPDTVKFGLTTTDEMFAGIIIYTKSEPVGINDVLTFDSENILIYPNPARDNFQLQYILDRETKVRIELYTIYGRQVALLANKSEDPVVINWI